MIIIVATFGQALSGSAPAIHIINVLVVWRFLVRSTNHNNICSQPIDGHWDRRRLPSLGCYLFRVCLHKDSRAHDDGRFRRSRVGKLQSVFSLFRFYTLILISYSRCSGSIRHHLCLQGFYPKRTRFPQSSFCRLHVASPHRTWLCPWCHRALLPLNHP